MQFRMRSLLCLGESLANLRHILREAGDLGTVKWIYFEWGEPFLYYARLRKQRPDNILKKLGARIGRVNIHCKEFKEM